MSDTRYRDAIEAIRRIAREAAEAKCLDKETLDDIEERIENNEFRITIVGEFSSGKSTLLDALIGRDVLPHSTSETTATLTYIHNVEKGDKREDTAEVVFDNGNREKKTLGELMDFATAFSKLDVKSKVEYVDVYINIPNFDRNITLVDTPGLNGTNGYEERTLKEIERADASVFVFGTGGVKLTEQEFMRDELGKKQNSFFFVMNKIDTLHEHEGESETVEKKIEELREGISQNFFGGREKPKNVVGVSAWLALAARDKSIKKLYNDETEWRELNDEYREELWNKSRFGEFTDSLKEYLKEEKERVFVESLTMQIENILIDELESMDNEMKANAPKDDLPEKAYIEDEKREARARFKGYRENLQKNINAKMSDASDALEAQMRNARQEGRSKYETEKARIERVASLEEFDQTFGNDGSRVNTMVSGFCDRMYEKISGDLGQRLERIENELLEEIKAMTKGIATMRTRTASDTVNIGKSAQQYRVDTSEAGELNRKIEQEKANLARMEREKGATESRRTAVEQEKASKEQELRNKRGTQTSLNSEISTLNRTMPAVTSRQVRRTRQVRVERSILNPFRWFGDKYTYETQTYYDTVYDSSARDAQMKKVQEKQAENSRLQQQIWELESQIENFPDMKEELQRMQRDIERKRSEIERTERELREKIAENEQKMRYQRTQYLNERKAKLAKALEEVLTSENSSIYKNLRKDAEEFLRNSQICMTEGVRKHFEKESEKYMKNLDRMLATLTAASGNDEAERNRKAIGVSKAKAEAMLREVKGIRI